MLLEQQLIFSSDMVYWMAIKNFEMGRYGASELMRNKNLQKKL